MQANAAEKLNNSYIRLPKTAKISGLSFGLQKVIGEIFSFTGEDKGGKVLSCFRSYDRFKERCGVSRATVGRALNKGRAKGLIKGDRKQGFKYLITSDENNFNCLPGWICKDKFAVRENVTRKLTNAEQCVYAVFYTECTKHKNGKHVCEFSIAQLAEETGLSERTVFRAKWTLIRSNLVYCSKEDNGVNRYKVSRYTLNYKLVLQKAKNEKAIRKEVEKALAEQEKQAAAFAAEPFPEFAEQAAEGEELFVLHNEVKKRSKKKSQTDRSKTWIDIPEREYYTKNNREWGAFPEYDFSKASLEELKAIKAFYSPLWQYLGVIGEGFITCVGFEIERREGSPPQGSIE